jgi:hypothetical protein
MYGILLEEVNLTTKMSREGPSAKIRTEDLSNTKRKSIIHVARPHSIFQNGFLSLNIGRQVNIFVNVIV